MLYDVIMKSYFSPEQVSSLFQSYTERWWIAGGWAIDLFLGEQTREHEDVDVAILRNDEQAFRRHLDKWELWPGLGNSRLEDKPIATNEELSENREVLWCRPSANSDWAFELLLNKTIGREWAFKRDIEIRRPLKEVGQFTAEGIPYLNPEIVLLFKAKNNNEKDQHDFTKAVLKLDDAAKAWLGSSLRIVHPGHSWLESLE